LYVNPMPSTRLSPIITNTKQNITIDTHIRYLLVMMILNRNLNNNQLSGTIPSSIGSLVNLYNLYVNPMPSTRLSPIITNTKQNITIDTHIRYLLVMMMILNRDLDHNQLSGTIPSSIGSFLNLHYLYVNPIPSTDILQSSPTTSTIYHDTHNDTC